MEYNVPCPEPDDDEGWRMWVKVFVIGAVIVAFIFGVFLFAPR
jgi:hypothetical protein